jgi:predicted nucleotidyltransferase
VTIVSSSKLFGGESLKGNGSRILRERVAREAALLIYSSQEKEYKQAKQTAAENLRTRILPSNFEVAEELDRIAEEREGESRKKLLLRMRREAQQIMSTLREFSPCLVGSVWRGTARKNSDVDIVVYPQDHRLVLEQLQSRGFKVKSSKWSSVTKEGKKEASFHIQVILPSGDEAEVVVRSPQSLGRAERCEIYGDVKKGLNLRELEKTLKEYPLQKFVPV